MVKFEASVLKALCVCGCDEDGQDFMSLLTEADIPSSLTFPASSLTLTAWPRVPRLAVALSVLPLSESLCHRLQLSS